MPRRPQFIHPLRRVREMLGAAERRKITQTQFGRRLGYSGSYIQRIELGKVRPPRHLCEAVQLLAGVSSRTLMFKSSKPRMYNWKPITIEALREHKSNRDTEDHSIINLFALKRAEVALAALGIAASGSRNTIDAVLLSFHAWLDDAVKQFGLRKEYTREFEKRASEWNTAMKRSGDELCVGEYAEFSHLPIPAIDFLAWKGDQKTWKSRTAALKKAFNRGLGG